MDDDDKVLHLADIKNPFEKHQQKRMADAPEAPTDSQPSSEPSPPQRQVRIFTQDYIHILLTYLTKLRLLQNRLH